MWIRRKVQKGTKTGQRIGFPTLNFRVGHFDEHYPEGVYSCDIQIADKIYQGALYYGPRLSHRGKVLEIHVQKFDKKIYGQFVQFRVLKKIRGAKKFDDLGALKKQIQNDLVNLD